MTDLDSSSLIRPTRRLTLLYVLALSMIAMLTLVGQFVVQQAIVRLEGDSRIVNVAGRQRMLSQRLTRMALQLDIESPQASLSIDKVRSELAEWVNHHVGLQIGSEEPALPGNNSPNVQSLFLDLEPSFTALKHGLEQLVSRFQQSREVNLTKFERDDLCKHSDRFLMGMDAIVVTLEHEATERVGRLRWIERGLLLATIVVLLLEGMFIFSPAVASLQRTLQRLQKVSNELAIAKQTAEEANLAKSDFLTRVSHELRTPLHAVQGMLSLVERDPIPANQRKRIRIAKQAALSLGGLVDDLLDISGIEQHRDVVLRKSPVDLKELVLSVIELMRPHASEKGIELNLRLGASIPDYVNADPDRLRQILSNLIQNGIRFTSKGYVQCDLAYDPLSSPSLRLEVSDTGSGIAPQDREKVFQSFIRGHQSHAQPAFGQGLGLGLSIVHGLVQRMGGKIFLDSQLGKGSVFTVELPVELETAPADISPDVPLDLKFSSQALRTALIVDDSIANLALMRSYMKLLGYRTMSVQTLREAKIKIDRHKFDVILMDKHLPDGRGDTIAAFVQEQVDWETMKDRTKLYLVTADFTQALNGTELLGFDGVLTKPLSLEQLQATLTPLPIPSSTNQSDTPESTLEASNTFHRIRERLQAMVLESLPIEVSTMQHHAKSGAIDQVQFVAHRIRGAAGNAGLSQIELISKDLEDASIEANLPQIHSALLRLEVVCRREP